MSWVTHEVLSPALRSGRWLYWPTGCTWLLTQLRWRSPRLPTATLVGKYSGLCWLDPAMGVVGAVLVANWSVGLIRTTSRVLLDRQAPHCLCSDITEAVQSLRGSSVSDLHVWAIGPGRDARVRREEDEKLLG